MVDESVESAVRADVEALGELPKATRSLIASAVSLARQLDSAEVSATAKAAVARSLRETMDRLRELAPGERQRSSLESLAERRAERRARAAA